MAGPEQSSMHGQAEVDGERARHVLAKCPFRAFDWSLAGGGKRDLESGRFRHRRR
jgi:hypothetical protein